MEKVKIKPMGEGLAAPQSAVKIIGHDSGGTWLLVDIGQFYENDNGYYRFEIIRKGDLYYIDRVVPVTRKQWMES